jgi:hypothetical protein
MIWWLLAIPPAALAALVAVTPLVDARRHVILRQILRDVCTVLHDYGLDYWCDFGTLLGYYRDGDVIRSDYDVDLCMLDGDKPKLLALAGVLKARGYTLANSNGTTKLVVRIWNDRTGYYADMYTYRPDGPMLRSTFRSVEDLPAALVAGRTDVPFLGTTIRVPHDIEPLLLHRYGPTFRTPRRADQGVAYGYRRWEAFLRVLENNCVGIWSVAKSAVTRRAAR